MLFSILSFCSLDLAAKQKIRELPASFFPHKVSRRLTLRRAQNPGLCAGFLAEREKAPLLLSFLGTAASFVCLLPSCFRKKKDRLFQIGSALLLGGALGNLLDRAKNGTVTDFLHFDLPGLRRLILNLADIFLLVGSLLLTVSHLGKRRPH